MRLESGEEAFARAVKEATARGLIVVAMEPYEALQLSIALKLALDHVLGDEEPEVETATRFVAGLVPTVRVRDPQAAAAIARTWADRLDRPDSAGEGGG